MTIERVLIANRGEIACRILRSCHALGKSTVAVFSDADAEALHVSQAETAVHIGPAPAIESYLAIDKIIEAARLSSADAIHPGYGFLAENADFAQACADAGLVFIGPSPGVIALLGSKRESKSVVQDAGVPVIPGYSGQDQSAQTLRAEAIALGVPVMLKASAGGGGKGMRIVRTEGELDDAIESARRESASAFGDDTLLIERYIERPRHVEIQILGDSHGNVIHLGERECSIQRRHQKIIEETPCPALDASLRARMAEAAIAIGRVVGYQSAGTVEFILDSAGEFYFLEVNTRLQVEHAITECVTGVDLVREQIRIAEGAALDLARFADLAFSGHALECRLYAEDPDNDFLPTSGTLLDWQTPTLDGLRVDTGVGPGHELSIHYDPMLAKLITHAPTRAEAIATMLYSLRQLAAPGLVTNRDYLIRVLGHEAFRAGKVDTHFTASYAEQLAAPEEQEQAAAAAALAAALYAHESRRRARRILPELTSGFRNNRSRSQRVRYQHGELSIDVSYRNLGDNRFLAGEHEVRIAEFGAPWIVIEDHRGLRVRYRVNYQDKRDAGGVRWFVQSGAVQVVLLQEPRFPDTGQEAIEGGCIAPMPGKTVKVLVAQGQSVKAGETLVVLEAMKMEHRITAPADGEVAELAVCEGDQVDAGQLLVVVQPAAP